MQLLFNIFFFLKCTRYTFLSTDAPEATNVARAPPRAVPVEGPPGGVRRRVRRRMRVDRDDSGNFSLAL